VVSPTHASAEQAQKEKKAEESNSLDYKHQIVEDKEGKKKAALMLKAMQAQAGVTEGEFISLFLVGQSFPPKTEIFFYFF